MRTVTAIYAFIACCGVFALALAGCGGDNPCGFPATGPGGSPTVTGGSAGTLQTVTGEARHTSEHHHNAPLAAGALRPLAVGSCGDAGLLMKVEQGGATKLLFVDPEGSGKPQVVEPSAGSSRQQAALFFDADCSPVVLRATESDTYKEYTRSGGQWTGTELKAGLEALLGDKPSRLRHVHAQQNAAGGKMYVISKAGAGGKAVLVRGERGTAAGSQWTFTRLPQLEATDPCAYQVAPDGTSHVLFRNTPRPCDPCNMDLVLGRATAGADSWTTEVVQKSKWGEPDDEFVESASMAFDPAGTLYIAAHFVRRVVTGSYKATELRLYGKVEGTWCSETVASRNDGYAGSDGDRLTGGNPQMVMDGKGRLHVLFCDLSSWHDSTGQNALRGQLRHALRSGHGWTLTTLMQQKGQTQSSKPVHGLVSPALAVSAGGARVAAAGVALSWQTDSIYNNTDMPATYDVRAVSATVK